MDTSASRLIVRRGHSSQQVYSLSEQATTIGREANNEIVFEELEISRRHASVTFVGGRHMIEDLGSTNGTFVNGRRISTAVPLRDGDVIDMGDSVSFIFHSPPEKVDATLIEPEIDEIGEATVQQPGGAAQQQYSPPPDVPQYGQQPEAPVPAATGQISQAPYPQPGFVEETPIPPPEEKRDVRRMYLGCGCLLLLFLVVCIASFAFLDSYQSGDFLYCQSLRPMWEFIFGSARVAVTCQ